MDASDYRRENEDWDLNSPDLEEEGRRVNALFQYLVGIGELQEFDEEDLENFTRLKSKKFELEKQMEEDENARPDLETQISQIDDELLQYETYVDVYDMEPTDKSFYDLARIDVPKLGQSFYVGDEGDMEYATRKSLEDLIDEQGYEGFAEWIIEDNLDTEEIIDFFKDVITDWTYDDPESYLEDSDRELSKDQQKMFQSYRAKYLSLRNRIDVLRQAGTKELDYDTDNAYKKMISQLEDALTTLDEQMLEITNNPEGEFPDEKIDEAIERQMEEVEDDPVEYLKYQEYEINRFIDQEGVIDDIIRHDGYTHLASYDGEVNEENVNGETYYIVRID